MKEIFKKWIGVDFLNDLTKSVEVKNSTNTVVEHEEILTAMKVVPRAILLWLKSELKEMTPGQFKDLHLPFVFSGRIHIEKKSSDVYNGIILKENMEVVRFNYKSLPGVGLSITSAFELYDIESSPKEDIVDKDEINRKIDERIALIRLIGQVVDEKISQREAIHEAILRRIRNNLEQKQEVEEQSEDYSDSSEENEDFLEKIKDEQN